MASMPNMDNFTPEQLEKLKDATSMEKLLEIAADEDIEFTSEQLEYISGGEGDYWAAASNAANA